MPRQLFLRFCLKDRVQALALRKVETNPTESCLNGNILSVDFVDDDQSALECPDDWLTASASGGGCLEIEPSCVEDSITEANLIRRTMLKRFIWLAVATVFFTFQMVVTSATALEMDASTRTVKLNEQGETTTLSLKQVKEGKRLFNFACAQCHAGGVTKTDFNVGLGPDDLAGATPPRDNVAALVDYMKHPTTYDGETPIAEVHPSTDSADIFTEMRNLSDDDLAAIAGHILIQPQVLGGQWGGGKAVR